MKRNGEIEWWRFIASLMIIDFHFPRPYLFPGGRIGVEFFFLLSGYFLAASAMRKVTTAGDASWHEINQETYSQLKHRVCAFFPETLIACMLALLVYIVAVHPNLHTLAPCATSTIFGDACFLGMSGLFNGGANGVTWYLSTLLMGVGLIYPIIRRCGIPPILFIIGVLLLGALYINGSSFDCAGVKVNVGTYKGNVRGVAEMLIGASLYPVIQTLSNATIGNVGKRILTLLKWGMCVCVLCYAYRTSFVGHNVGFALFVLCGILVLSLSGHCVDTNWFQHKIFAFLGKFSLSLYLSHAVYADYLPKLLPDSIHGITHYAVYILCVFVSALGVMYAARGLRRFVSFAMGTHTSVS